jgi:hypothetical protein
MSSNLLEHAQPIVWKVSQSIYNVQPPAALSS